MESRFGDDPRLQPAGGSLSSLSEDIEGELGFQKELIGCYGKHLDKLSNFLGKSAVNKIARAEIQGTVKGLCYKDALWEFS